MQYREPESPAPRARRRPPRVFVRILLVVLVVLAVTLRGMALLWTDYLWFKSVALASVWRTLILSRVALVAIATVVAFLVLWANLLIADRLSPRFVAAGLQQDELVERFQAWIESRTRMVYLVVAAFFALLIGLSAGSWWEHALQFRYGVAFGEVDPVFGNDLSFYVFKLPLLRDLFAWFFQFLLVTTVLVGVLHYLNGGIRIQQGFQRVSAGVKVHLSVLLAGLALLKAAAYQLDSYDLLYSTRGAVFGATYTDVRAQLPALRLLVFISIFAAVLLLVNIRVRGWTLPAVAGGLWLATSVIIGAVVPAAVQRISVVPDEITKELPYVERNIEFSRRAYGLDNIAVRTFAGAPDLTAADLAANEDTIANIRLWDPAILRTTYRQLEALRPYYQFQDVDVDRYDIEAQRTQVMLAARELEVSNVAERNWVNDHLVFTHGYGAVVSRANDVTQEGQPDFVVNDIPPRATIDDFGLAQPRIYFGEQASSGSFVVVGTSEREVDALTATGEVSFNSYDGEGGVPAGTIFRRAAFALRFGDLNMLISGRITSGSKVLWVRNIRDRINKAAPFLAQDADPYLVVRDGRLFWILDLYTVTDRYPYSTPADPGRLDAGVAHSLPNGFNYIRNSAKAVVDAYDGTMNIYVVPDAQGRIDPIVETYRRIFPSVFDDLDTMPSAIRQNLRYPEDLFRVQGDMYTQYHVTDPRVLFNNGDPWEIARDPSTTDSGTLRRTESPKPMLPYYLLMKLPGDQDLSFLILQPFTPQGRPNMSAFLVAKSDADEYAQMIDFVFPSGAPPDGPNQVNARINQDPTISAQFTLLDQQGSSVERGNMLVVPIEESIMYVQPIYLAGEGTAGIPELKRVVVVFGDQITMQETFAESLNVIFGTPAPPTDGDGGDIPPDVAGTVEDLLARAQQAFVDADAALRAGDLATYQDRIAEAQQLVEQAARLLGPQGDST